MFFRVARQSLQYRKGSAILTLLAISVSIFVLLGVEHIRTQAKSSFNKTISGTDLVVGSRTGEVNLLLYSVFRVGNATNNISWQSYLNIADDKNVAWSIPISLGDSHKGYRVMGTTQDYFTHFKYGKKTSLEFSRGDIFKNIYDVVLGAEVARKLGYKLGDELVLAHGIAHTSFSLHDDTPFQVVGILKATGTPVDQTLHISLEGMEAIHVDWKDGVKIPGKSTPVEELTQQQLTPKTITAFMLGLKSKIATFQMQRKINQYGKEPLMAILPGVALSQLWQMMGTLETTLRLVSLLVLIASLLGLSAVLLASIRERNNEIAILRSIGARPVFVFLLIQTEALLIALSGMLIATLALMVCIFVGQSYLAENYGLYINANFITIQSASILLGIIVGTLLVASIPAVKAYRRCLHSGLNHQP